MTIARQCLGAPGSLWSLFLKGNAVAAISNKIEQKIILHNSKPKYNCFRYLKQNNTTNEKGSILSSSDETGPISHLCYNIQVAELWRNICEHIQLYCTH